MVEIFQDIRKLYKFCSPCEELAAHIEFYSESEPVLTKSYAGEDPFSVKMFSSWTPTFYINLGGSYQIFNNGQWHKVGVAEDILILRDSIVERYNQPSDNIFTVKFNPGGLEAVLGISQKNFVGRVTPLHQILPITLLMKLREPITFEERIGLMQVYFLELAVLRKADDHYLRLVNQAIGEYSSGEMQLTTDLVAQRVFLTSKTINRYFHRVIGLSPKQYFSILRARTALKVYLHDPACFFPEKYGYYDTSHFRKEIYKFTATKLRGIQ